MFTQFWDMHSGGSQKEEFAKCYIEAPENEAKITRIRKVDSKKDGILNQIVLDNTPFYPEGGGQVGDKGTLVSANETIEIIDFI